MKIIFYEKNYYQTWNSFLDSARNSHFFFNRDYMEYHSNRFEDFSLMIYNSKDKLVAVFPANKKESTVYSHQGLTFGGLIIGDNVKSDLLLEIFNNLKYFLEKKGIKSLIYKCIPYIYHLKPSSEEEYALFRLGAKLIRRDISSTINLSNKITYQEQRKRAIKKAIKNGLIVEESIDYKSFWKILEETLIAQHNTKPVHSLSEIEYLASKFKNNIKLFITKQEDKLLAGTVIFENKKVIHTQYLANSIEGKKIGALDFLIDHLISDVYNNKDFFDFGISTEKAGKHLNSGLIAQKEGFGARGIVHDFYELEI